MATYYVRVDGNDANTGTGQAINQAWATIQKALSATGISSGDIVYVAPGRYTEFVTVAIANPTALTRIVGDPTASQFTGISAGEVLWSARNSAGAKVNNNLLIYTTKNYLSFENIHFEFAPTSGQQSSFRCVTSTNTRLLRCQFTCTSSSNNQFMTFTSSTGNALNLTIDSCSFLAGDVQGGNINITGQNVSDSTEIRNSLFVGFYQNAIVTSSLQAKFVNNTFIAIGGAAVSMSSGSTSFPSTFTNGLHISCGFGIYAAASNIATENYNRFIGCTNNTTNMGSLGANSSTSGGYGVYGTYHLQQGLVVGQMFSTISGSVNTSFGTATGAPTTDLYGIAWTGTSPDSGSATYRSLSAVGSYIPTERNASTITIAPGSTSQSIELYLGVTGLAFNTSGLQAYYIRNRSAPVAITLVTQTATGDWTSGGFAQISSSLTPGIYRLDLPDAALAAGADDVTVVVRGASGTNGAVMTIKLSSGGLTSAQTASAVWGELTSGYTTGLDFGGVINEIRNVVGVTEAYVLDVPNQVWDELKANHTIPNSFGDYLDTKVSTGSEASRIQLRQGPFLIKQNAIDSVITEVNQFLSTVPNIEMVLIDSSGGSVSVAGATLVMRVRNQAGTAVVNNVTPTVAYADGGVIRWSPNLSWTALGVTTAGTYRIVVERTMSGVTTTFGPFLVQLSSG